MKSISILKFHEFRSFASPGVPSRPSPTRPCGAGGAATAQRLVASASLGLVVVRAARLRPLGLLGARGKAQEEPGGKLGNIGGIIAYPLVNVDS